MASGRTVITSLEEKIEQEWSWGFMRKMGYINGFSETVFREMISFIGIFTNPNWMSETQATILKFKSDYDDFAEKIIPGNYANWQPHYDEEPDTDFTSLIANYYQTNYNDAGHLMRAKVEWQQDVNNMLKFLPDFLYKLKAVLKKNYFTLLAIDCSPWWGGEEIETLKKIIGPVKGEVKDWDMVFRSIFEEDYEVNWGSLIVPVSFKL
jgi:hypothetical protein